MKIISITLVFEWRERLFSLSSHAVEDKTTNYNIFRRHRHFGWWSYFHFFFCQLRNFSLSKHSCRAVLTPHDYLALNQPLFLHTSIIGMTAEFELMWTQPFHTFRVGSFTPTFPHPTSNHQERHSYKLFHRSISGRLWWPLGLQMTMQSLQESWSSTVKHRKSGTAKCTDHQSRSRHSSGTGIQKCWFLV